MAYGYTNLTVLEPQALSQWLNSLPVVVDDTDRGARSHELGPGFNTPPYAEAESGGTSVDPMVPAVRVARREEPCRYCTEKPGKVFVPALYGVRDRPTMRSGRGGVRLAAVRGGLLQPGHVQKVVSPARIRVLLVFEA